MAAPITDLSAAMVTTPVPPAHWLAILPVVPGFVRAAATPGGQVANPGLFDTLYTYAWFVTFGLSFVLYLVLRPRHQR